MEHLDDARSLLNSKQILSELSEPYRNITAADIEQATWNHYTETLQKDTLKRATWSTPTEIEADREKLLQRGEAGEIDPADPVVYFSAYTEFELMSGASYFDSRNRTKRLAALRLAVVENDFRFVELAVEQYLADQKLSMQLGTTEWHELRHKITRAEIAALQRTLDRDNGTFNDTPSDPIIKQPITTIQAPAPVPLKQLFRDYISTRQAIGKHQDGGANWESAILALVKFLGHDDARKITKRNILDWRDALISSKMSAKTVSNKHLAAIRAVLRWAFENDRLPTNEAMTIHQEVPKKVQTREKGYTTDEAVKVLSVSVGYRPPETTNPSNQESAHLSATKKWVPLLCAFTGSRVTEMTQLRREDLRQDGEHWILRINPDAGSVKTKQYRDVPLHNQIIALGFIDFVNASKPGPLFHGAKIASDYLTGAKVTAGKLSGWLNGLGVVPSGVQPSHGWRHRFKTLDRELGLNDRIIDAIQGHAGQTAGDSYGDFTISAMLKVIDALPDYDLGQPPGH